MHHMSPPIAHRDLKVSTSNSSPRPHPATTLHHGWLATNHSRLLVVVTLQLENVLLTHQGVYKLIDFGSAVEGGWVGERERTSRPTALPACPPVSC